MDALASPPQPQPKSSSRVSPETVEKAVTALLNWKEAKSSSQKPQLLPTDEFVYLTLSLKKIPPKNGPTKPIKIPLPHPLLQDSLSSEICLIIDDGPKSNLTSEAAKNKVKSDNILVSKVLKFSKLKTDYKPFEAKRKLCDSYDLFFADNRVIPLLPKLLGKQFFKKRKLPIAVNLSHKNWKEQIERVCGSTFFYMKTGTCCVLKVAKVSMEREEIVENVVEAINGVVGFVPKKWEGVRSLHLKVSESLALPLYQTVPDRKLKIQGIGEDVEGVEDDGGSQVEAKEGKKEGGKVVKRKEKKGRIHEVRYMDVGMHGDDEVGNDFDRDGNESEMFGDDDLVFTGKKRKNEDHVEKSGKTVGKKGKVGRVEANIENEGVAGEDTDDDLGSAEMVVKKKTKKHESTKELISSGKKGEKRQKKLSKEEDTEKEKESHSYVKAVEGSGVKKGKKKTDLETTVKNSTDKKVKKKKKSAARFITI